MVKKLINIINSQLDCDIPDARSAISLSEKAINSLQKKSEKHDIPYHHQECSLKICPKEVAPLPRLNRNTFIR